MSCLREDRGVAPDPQIPMPSDDAGTLIVSIGMGLIGILIVIAAVLGCPALGQTVTPVSDPAFQKSTHDCPPPGITIDGTVIRVIDGDTVVVRSSVEYHVRLLDCWAPESRTIDAAEKQRGLKSKARMVELATGKVVRVHLPGKSNVTDMLTLGRVLGRVWILQSGLPAPTDLSSIMVAEELATATKQANP